MALEESAIERIEGVFQKMDQPIWLVTASAKVGAQDRAVQVTLRRGGLVASWVLKASINPQVPVVNVGLAPNHFTTELIQSSRAFALHLVSADQFDIALALAIGSGRDRDKLAGIPHRFGTTGSPIIADCLAWMECRVICEFDAGDRIYFLADVVEGERLSEQTPLSESQFFQLASNDQKRLLKQDRDKDIELQKPLLAQWRANR